MIGQHMPNDYQQLPRDSYDRFLTTDSHGQGVEGLLPRGRMFNGHPRGFDHHRADLASALLGDPPGVVRLARSVHTRPQTTIAHQLFRTRETLDFADNHDPTRTTA